MTPAAAPAEAAVSVLIVDDDVWTTRALGAVLAQQADLRALPPVHSGEAAIEAYRELRPEVVLMDVNMAPGMSGIEATAAIRGFDPEARIVILTTMAPGPGLARALEAGAMAAVHKTASDAVLLRTIRLAAAGDDPRLLKNLAVDVLISGDPIADAPAAAPVLTAAEVEVLRLVCLGWGYEEIAEQLGVTVWTAKTHTKRLREKLVAENFAQLVVRALQYRFVSS